MKRIDDCLQGCSYEMAEVLRAAAAAALEGGAVVREMYEKPHQIRLKGVIDLVTEADLASEKEILAVLEQRFPGSAVLAEESSADYAEMPVGALWIVDPLDGTTNFAHGFPYFAVSIAYSIDGISQVGVIYCPVQNELFCAVKGGGAWLNGRPISVSAREVLIESLVGTGFPYAIHEKLDPVIAQLRKVLPVVRDVRRAGAAALDLAYVACGRLDGFWEIDLKPWDTAAGQLLVEEAGGSVSDLNGRNWTPYQPEILASNGRIHALLSALF